MALVLHPPDWDSLAGGSAEASWIADRYRKLGIATSVSNEIERVFLTLRARNALFAATKESVLSDRFAGQWYVSLAGFSQKTLANTIDVPKKFGMSQKPISLIDALAQYCDNVELGKGRVVPIPISIQKNLRPFVEWINHELKNTLSEENQTPERVLVRVSLLLGGRIIGQGQNEGGNEGVILVKELLYQRLSQKFQVEIRSEIGAEWQVNPSQSAIAGAVEIRFDKRMECDFRSGGNRPDVKVSLDGKIIAVGEIKARKDLSNLWESWMPQIVAHMKTWRSEFPDAARLFFGTVITHEMIAGASVRGTRHTGLGELIASGELTAVYNLSHIVDLELRVGSGLRNFTDALAFELER